MSPRKLTLKGFRGIRDALAQDELVFDLEALAGDAQLVCLAGPNGSGKTTLMDNLHPYRLMPSRASGLSPATFSYYEHLSQPEAVKQLEWRHEGTLYRSSLVLRMNGAKRRTEAYLHRQADGEWQPVRLADGTLSDGKIDTYDRCVEALLGNPETFFTSVFSAQDRRPLSAYANGEIKALMVELLGLNRIREIGEQANEVVKHLKLTLEQERTAITGLARMEEEVAVLRAESAHAENAVERLAAAIAQRKHELVPASAKLMGLRAELARTADTEQRRASPLAERRAVEETSNRAKTASHADIQREVERRQRSHDRLTQLRADWAKRKAQLNQALERATARAQRQPEVDRAVTEVQVLAEREHTAKGKLAELRQRANTRAELARERDLLAAKRDALEREAAGAVLRLDELKRRCGLIGEVPCVGTDLQPRCKLLGDAHEATSRVPRVQGELGQLRTTFRELVASIEKLDTELKAYGDTQAALQQQERLIEELLAEQRSAEAVAALAPAVLEAAERVKKLHDEIETSEQSVAQEIEKLLTEAREVAAVIDALNARLVGGANRQQEQLARLQAELDALPEPFEQALLGAAQGDVQRVEGRIAADETRHLEAIARQAGINAKLQERSRLIAESAIHQDRATRLSSELGWWNLLAKAFGNDGIIALCIDDAGPTLSALANDLLLACYGPRFSVSIRTQVETAKKDVREGFEIVVFDAQSEQAKNLSVMSGGERVWIQEALTRAIALYLSNASQRRYETLFSDEADGALDPERKRMFMAMKREVLRLGGYRREVYVTQTPELASLADIIIDPRSLPCRPSSTGASRSPSGEPSCEQVQAVP